jgi:hypothetical protein
MCIIFFPPWHYSPSGPSPTSMNFSVSVFLDPTHSVGLLGRVISSSQGYNKILHENVHEDRKLIDLNVAGSSIRNRLQIIHLLIYLFLTNILVSLNI